MEEQFNNTETSDDTISDKTANFIASAILFLGLSLVVVWGYDVLENESSIAVNMFLKGDCDFEIPSNYKVLSDGRYFVVQLPSGYPWPDYLSGWIGEIKDYPLDVSEPTRLRSECKARAYIKLHYLSKNKLHGYKEINLNP